MSVIEKYGERRLSTKPEFVKKITLQICIRDNFFAQESPGLFNLPTRVEEHFIVSWVQRHSMIRNASVPGLKLFLVVVTIWLSVIVFPAGASFVFQDVSVTPAPPLVPGHVISSSSQLVIIPQGGSSTFVRTNQLELATQLDAARWNVVVMVNGRPAAQMPVNGNTVFVNGFLLSYPVTSDVAVSIQVNGTVPDLSGPEMTIVDAVQLNNAGQAVPGSLQSVVEPLEARVAPSPSATMPAQSGTPTTRAPTITPGFSTEVGVLSLVICGIVIAGTRNNRKN